MYKYAIRYCNTLANRYNQGMDLKKYLAEERGRQSAIAKAIGAHAPDVSRWADGTRPIPVAYGAPIEHATGGAVTRKEMFPDDWEKIWPELAAFDIPQADAASCPHHTQRESQRGTEDRRTVDRRAEDDQNHA